MLGQEPTKANALDLLTEAKDFTLIVKRNNKKIGIQHTGNWITITKGAEPIERLLDMLAFSVVPYNPNADKNKRKIKKWFKEDLFHDDLNQILFADK